MGQTIIKSKAKIEDWEAYIKAGVDPRTKTPDRLNMKSVSKENILRMLRIMDEQAAVNKGKWKYLPKGMTSQEVERWLYYKGQLIFFYYKPLEQFLILPYTLDGTIDCWGRYVTVHAIPFAGGTTEKEKEQFQILSDKLAEYKLKVAYDIILPEDLTEEDLYHTGVIIRDYTNQLSQTTTPRSVINEGILGFEAEILPMLKTSLLEGTGVRGVRVADGDQSESVIEAAKSLEFAALNGLPYIPITGKLEMQELSSGAATNAQDYLMTLEAIDNLRLSTFGIDNGGLYDKKAYVNNMQTGMNQTGGGIGLINQDYVTTRQTSCNIINSIWGIGMWYEPSETVVAQDLNGDGVMYDREDGGQDGNTETEV